MISVTSKALNLELEPFSIKKRWLYIPDDTYIWVEDDVKVGLKKYIRYLDKINNLATKDVLNGVRKRIARICAKYDIPIDILDKIDIKHNSLGHAAYFVSENTMKIVPDYFMRFGVIRFGGKLINEFDKTFLHEFGHAVSHNIDKEKFEEYIKLIPKFYNNDDLESYNKYTKGSTIRMDGAVLQGDLWTKDDEKFYNNQARYSPNEDYAEMFALFIISPKVLKEFDEKRYNFFKEAKASKEI